MQPETLRELKRMQPGMPQKRMRMRMTTPQMLPERLLKTQPMPLVKQQKTLQMRPEKLPRTLLAPRWSLVRLHKEFVV